MFGSRKKLFSVVALSLINLVYKRNLGEILFFIFYLFRIYFNSVFLISFCFEVDHNKSFTLAVVVKEE